MLFVDASSTSIGFTLAQIQNGKEVVIAYNDRGLNQAGQSQSTKEREILVLVKGIKKFQPYLHNCNLTVVTDHSSLRWLMLRMLLVVLRDGPYFCNKMTLI